MYIKEQGTRSLLRRYSTTSKKKSKPLNGNEYENLISLLEQNAPELYDVMHSFQRDAELEDHSYATFLGSKRTIIPRLYKCPPKWSPLLSGLASAFPVCGFLHLDDDLLAVIRRIAISSTSVDLADLEILKRKFPVMYDLLMTMDDLAVPACLRPVLLKMERIAKQPFTKFVSWNSCALAKEDSQQMPFSYWPALPLLRRRGEYQADTKQSKTRRQERCTKLSSGHAFLLPGIFTLFCKHGSFFRFSFV